MKVLVTLVTVLDATGELGLGETGLLRTPAAVSNAPAPNAASSVGNKCILNYFSKRILI